MKTFNMLMMAAITILSLPVFAQDSSKHTMKMQGVKMEKATYCCPMCPDATSNKPGTCSQCAIERNRSPKEKMKMEVMKIYTCSMHPGVTNNRPGKCSGCAMDMNRSPKEKMKMEVMKTYSCPMHPEVTSDKAGKCSKCGMELTKKKDAGE